MREDEEAIRADERERIVRELEAYQDALDENEQGAYKRGFRFAIEEFALKRVLRHPAPEPKRLERLTEEMLELEPYEVVRCINALIDAENERRGKV